MRSLLSRALALMLVFVLAVAAGAQERQRGERGERGGRGRFGGPGFGGPGGFRLDRLTLVRIEPVQEELGLVEEQLTQINDLRAELRPERGFGRSGEGRPNFQDMTEEERREFFETRQREAAERSAKEKEKLADVLMPHQAQRLEEIFIQVRGVGALQDPTIAEAVGLTEDDQEALQDAIQQARDGMRVEMRDLLESGDREQIREKMTAMQQKVEQEALTTLSDEQKQKFTELKGEKFDLPPEALRGAFGGRGGREGRPQRPQRPDGEV